MFVKVIHEKESVIYKEGIYKKDDVFEVDEVIAESLIERGYVVPTEVSEAEVIDVEYEEVEEEVETVKGKWDKEDLKTWKVAELKELAEELGIEATGKKEELIEKICEVEVEIPSDEIITEEEFEEIQEASEEETDGEGPDTGMPE